MCAMRTLRSARPLAGARRFPSDFSPSPRRPRQQSANDYPNRTIRIVVGFTPGGAPDITARVIAQNLSEQWKQPVVVENRPGAGSAIAAQYVANAAPDGYTLMSITNAHAVAPAINPRLAYDALKDFAPITMTSSAPKWILVSPSLGVKTLKDFVALAKAKPNDLNYSSSGGGSFMHFSAAMFNDAVGIEAQHIPFKGPPGGADRDHCRTRAVCDLADRRVVEPGARWQADRARGD